MTDIYQQLNININNIRNEINNFQQNIKDDLNAKYPPQDKNVLYSRVLSSISNEYSPKNKDIKYTKKDKLENINIDMTSMTNITQKEAEEQLNVLNDLRKDNSNYNTDFLYAIIYYKNTGIISKYSNDINQIKANKSLSDLYKDLFTKYKI
jgi:hypothetical protein